MGILPVQESAKSIEKVEEVSTIEALQPTDYKRANLEEIAANCQDISIEQQRNFYWFSKPMNHTSQGSTRN